MKKLVNFFEDPDNPSMGGTINFFKLTFLWNPSRAKYQTIIYYFALFFTSMLILNQFINLSLERQPHMFLTFIQFTAYHLGVIKFITFEIYHRKWEKIVQWVSTMEIEVMGDPNCKIIIDKYKKHGRNIVLFFWVLGVIINVIYFSRTWILVLKDRGLDGKLRINEKTFYFLWPSLDINISVVLYLFVQNLYGNITSVYVLGWDALCLSVLVAFSGQLKVVRERFRQALDTETTSEQKKNLIACHKHYISIIEAQKNCNDFLSPALFTHLLVISVNFSVIIANMSTYSQSEILLFSLFMSGLLSETSLYYWHGNDVMVQSELVCYSMFESAWVDKSVDIRRMVTQMSRSTSKRLMFSAGPFNNVSLSTFLGILRATYSYYTLMVKTS